MFSVLFCWYSGARGRPCPHGNAGGCAFVCRAVCGGRWNPWSAPPGQPEARWKPRRSGVHLFAVSPPFSLPSLPFLLCQPVQDTSRCGEREERLPASAAAGAGRAWRGWHAVVKAGHFAPVPEFRHPTHLPHPFGVQSNHAPALWQLPDTYVLLITDVCSLQVSY